MPDAEQCTRALLGLPPYYCNNCEKLIDKKYYNCSVVDAVCVHCGISLYKVCKAAVARLYGGCDYFGNQHHTAFTREILERYLTESGFDRFEYLEDENNYMIKNWSIKIKALKHEDLWHE